MQGLVNRGYVVSEVESEKPWKLEKADIKEVARKRINKLENLLKNDKNTSPKTKQKPLENLRKMSGIIRK